MQEARQDTGTRAGPQAHGKTPRSAKVLSQLPMQTVVTANTILGKLGVLQELPQEVLPELIAKTVVRRGKGGRQKQVDPMSDPRFAGLEPAKVARILANREAAARSKLKAKLLKELQLQKLKGQPGSSTITAAPPKPQPAAAAKPPAGRSAARAAATARNKERAARTAAAATAAAAAAEADALAALDCLAAVAAGEEMLPPDSGTPAHRGAADPHGLHQQLDAGAHRQRDSRRSSSSVAAAAAKAGQLRCDEQQLLTASSDELGEMQDSEEADRAAHLRVMRRLQQIQQQRRGAAAAAAAVEFSGGSSDSAKRKRASPDSAGADMPAAAAAAVLAPAGAAAVGEHAHRSKRKRHMTSRAAEAAAAGLIPTAGLSPEEALAATAAHSALLQMQQQQPKVLGRGPAAAAAAAAFGGDDLSRQIHTEVQLLSSIDKATVMEALERLFRLLASLLVSDDERADDALTLALQGLLGLLRNSASSAGFGDGSSSSRDGGGWSDLQLTALAVLDTLARQEAAYRECVVACGAPVVLVRLLEGAGNAAVQVAAVQALQALLQHGDVSTVEAVADAHGVEVLLLAVARGRAGSALRQAAAGCLCSMADVHPDHAEVAVAAAGVRYMAAAADGAASSSRA